MLFRAGPVAVTDSDRSPDLNGLTTLLDTPACAPCHHVATSDLYSHA